MFVMLNSHGDEIGHYEGGPDTVAKKVAREVYKNTGQTKFHFKIMNKHTSHIYSYATNIHLLKNPQPIKIGNNSFYKKYEIELKRI